MELKNCIFAHVYDWLHRKGMVDDQLDLAEKTKISKNTITNILNGRTTVSDKTIRKLNEGFGNIFNMQYLRGIDPYHMLIQDVIDDGAESIAPFTHKPEQIEEQPDTEIPAWADTFINILSKQVVENEALNRQLKAELEEVRTLRAELQQAITAFRIIQHGKVAPYSPFIPEYAQAAEPNN